MQIYSMGRNELNVLSLPQKVSGQHTLNYTAENGDMRLLLRINAKDDEWHISETKSLQIRDAKSPGESKGEYILYENAVFYLRFNDSENIILMVIPESVNRSLYSYYKIPVGGIIDIGQADFNQIRYENEYINPKRHLRIRYKEDGSISVGCCDDTTPVELRTPAYLNRDRINKDTKAELGDCVFLLGLKIVLGAGFIAVNNPENEVTVRLEALKRAPFIPVQVEDEEQDVYEPAYFSSAPREKREIIHRKFEVDNPPEDAAEQEIPWIVMMGPSVTMAMGSVFSSVITINNILASGGNTYTALPSFVTSIIMVLGSVVWPFFGRRIQDRSKSRKAAVAYADYSNYLKRVNDEIDAEKETQTEILLENNPTVEDCIQKILKEEETLWDRSRRHNDFLTVQIGRGDVPLDAEFSYPKRQVHLHERGASRKSP